MTSLFDINQTTQWPPDRTEQEIPGAAEAEAYLISYLPEVYRVNKECSDHLAQRYGLGIPQLPLVGYEVSVICLARIALRHGSTTSKQFDYHNEIHALDVVRHLQNLTRYNPNTQEHGDGLHQLDALSCLCLQLFAMAHDLRQSEPGYADGGVGNNEQASAEEAMRILVSVGLNKQEHPSIFQLLWWMIQGSTFFTKSIDFSSPYKMPGALAPVIADQVASGGDVEPFSAAQAADLILLAADIDTANVAQSIEQYAEQSLRMCRESHRSKDLTKLDQLSSHSILDFLTSGQERYFFELQRFYSRLANNAFGPSKQQTGEHLKLLIGWLRSRYEGDLPAGDVILNDFLSKAKEISHR